MSKKINVQGLDIAIYQFQEQDYISLTDMLKAKDGDFFISDWLRNRNTVEYLGKWEGVHNPGFNYGKYATIGNQAGLNSYKISVKEWLAKTNAIGLTAKAELNILVISLKQIVYNMLHRSKTYVINAELIPTISSVGAIQKR